VLTALLLLEGGVRLVGWGLQAQQQARIRGALGQDGAYRILCLGDSMTARQYPSHLEAALARRVPDKPIAVLDEGRARMTATAIVAALPDHLDRYEPDMVIVMMGYNDDDHLLAYGDLPPTDDTPWKSYDLLRVLMYQHRNRVRGGQADEPTAPPGGRRPPDCGEVGLTEGERATCLADAGRTDEAIEVLEAVVERAPDDLRARDELARLCRHVGRREEARAHLERILDQDPDNVPALNMLSTVHREEGRLEEAEIALRQVQELRPDHEWALYELGRVLTLQDRHEEAEEVLARSSRANPRGQVAQCALAWWYRDRGRPEDAAQVLDRALEDRPDDDRLLSILAFVREDQGRPQEAADLRERVRELRNASFDPATRDAYRGLREAVLERGATLVCMQYPMHDRESLQRMLAPAEGELYVDSEALFRDAVHRGRFEDLFLDMYGGDFGHPTAEGNRLLAEHLAEVLGTQVFDPHLD